MCSVKRRLSRLPSKATGTVCIWHCLVSATFWWRQPRQQDFQLCSDDGTNCPKERESHSMDACWAHPVQQAHATAWNSGACPNHVFKDLKQGQRWTCQSVRYGERIRGFWQLKQYWWSQEPPYNGASAGSQQTNLRSQHLLPALHPP